MVKVVHRFRPPAGGPRPGPTGSLELSVTGMTCAACVARVERSLTRLDGVATAQVNLLTSAARVGYDPEAVSEREMIGAVEEAGYGALPARSHDAGLEAEDGQLRSLERRKQVASALSMPGALLVTLPWLRFRHWQWWYLASTVPIVIWAGGPFHRRALKAARTGSFTMDTLVSLGTLSALASGTARLIAGDAGHHDLEVAGGVTAFMLVGRVMEAQARSEAGLAVRTLLERAPRQASVVEADGTLRRVPAVDLAVGDRVVVRPGEQVTADGLVQEGSSTVDQSMLTGESTPVEVTIGSPVAGGTVNVGGGLLTVTVTRAGPDTALARIARLVADAQLGKASVQRLADRIAAGFVPAVGLLAAVAAGRRLHAGYGLGQALDPARAVLVAACPCALGLATPAALMVGIGRGAELGLFIRSPEVLETTRQVDTVVLDKTGTLTLGEMTLERIVAQGNQDEILRMAAAVERGSEHPVGRAIAAAGLALDDTLWPVSDFRARAGYGVEGTVRGQRVSVAPPQRLLEAGASCASLLTDAADRARLTGALVVGVAWGGSCRGLLVLRDPVRPTSRQAVESLRALGLRPLMVSGDHEVAARHVADQLGIEEVHAGALPEQKVAIIAQLQRLGRVVAMVGDGINDAPALAQADLGIAIGTGTDVAVRAADLTLASGDPRLAADAIRLARRTLSTVRQNLAWAGAYNLVVLPLAASGRLNPLIGGATMAASSLIVLSNSLRLRTFVLGTPEVETRS